MHCQTIAGVLAAAAALFTPSASVPVDPAPQGGSCTGPECGAESKVTRNPFTNHPHLHISFTDSPGETDINYPLDGGDPTCTNCSPCSTSVSVYEVSSGCSYTYSGSGNSGSVPGGSIGSPPPPVTYPLTRDCNAEGESLTTITATCWGGAPEWAAKTTLSCDAYDCQ